MVYYTDNKFNQWCRNPYQNNEPYDDSWIMVQLIEHAAFTSFTGNNGEGIFRLVLTKEHPQWQYCVMDFITYEKANGKNVIVSVDAKDLKEAQTQYAGHCYQDRFLRGYEAPVLVHTTTPDGYRQILKCGCLKSWNQLRRETPDYEARPIGALLGDPADYSDYIMFSHGGYFSELVVSSKEKGYIDSDIHSNYEAGARFYFDAEKIAKDGLLIRDGAHVKVKDSLDLHKYLLWIATPEIVGLPAITTPVEFAGKADDMFGKKYGDGNK